MTANLGICRLKHLNRMLMHARLDESSFACQRSTLNQCAYVAQQRAPISASSRFGVTQEGDQREALRKVMPNQSDEALWYARVLLRRRCVALAHEFVDRARNGRAQNDSGKRFAERAEIIFRYELRESEPDGIESRWCGCFLDNGAQATPVGRLVWIARNESECFTLSKRHAYDVADSQSFL